MCKLAESELSYNGACYRNGGGWGKYRQCIGDCCMEEQMDCFRMGRSNCRGIYQRVLVATHGRMATPVEDFMGDEEMEKKFDSQDFLDAEFNRESKILFIDTLDRLLSIKILTA